MRLIRKYKYTLVTILYFLSSLICGLSSAYTENGFFDRFLIGINVPNQHNYYNGFNSPYVKIKKGAEKIASSGKKYEDLLDYFTYNQLTNGVRQVADNDIKINLGSSSLLDLKLVVQNTSKIIDSIDLKTNFYPVDKNMFQSYFSGSQLKQIYTQYFAETPPSQQEYQPRFGADSFLYISDTLAEKLITFYEITEVENPYAELIGNEEYALLHLNVDGNENVMTASINSIIGSQVRFAHGVQSIYGDFAVSFVFANNAAFSSFSFDVDFKVNQFGNRQTLNAIAALGYSVDNSTFEFYTYDYQNKAHIHNEKLDQEFVNLHSKSYFPETVFYILVVFFSMLIVLVSFIKGEYGNKTNKIILFSNYFAFLIFGFIANFVNLYFLYSVFPIIGLILISFLYLKGVFKVREIIKKDPEYFEISI